MFSSSITLLVLTKALTQIHKPPADPPAQADKNRKQIMQVSLTGKVAVVTGAASGIGLAIVKQYLASGIAGLVAVDLAAEIPAPLAGIDHGGRLRYVGGDVGLDETARQSTSPSHWCSSPGPTLPACAAAGPSPHWCPRCSPKCQSARSVPSPLP